MKIILAGGGTGGHIFPNLALVKKLYEHFDEIEYIGCDNKKDEIILRRENFKSYYVNEVKLVRGKVFKNLSIPFRLLRSVNFCVSLLKKSAPDVVFCKGGFVCLPVSIACKRLKIPVVLHESDLSFGLANKLSLNFAKCVLTSFPIDYKNKKAIYTGSPIRDSFLNCEKTQIFDNFLPTILVVGGSSGAKELNDYVENNLSKLNDFFNVIHIFGCDHNKTQTKNYLPLKFSNNLGSLIKSSNLVITRGGANALFEIALLKTPALILPLKSATRGDQLLNAKFFEKQGLAFVYDEKLSFVDNVMSTYKKRKQIQDNLANCNLKNGTDCIVEKIVQCALKKH